MGIDQEIANKVDAYRSNPQALMQRYQQNQQLIDLLALQKLKSEKDAAAKQMQLQMAQNPQTIKQQREQELLERTKQDMVKQQAGIMQQAQQRQQQNIQQVAKQGAASPQQVQQVASGLGAIAQRKGMAAGGIVAFEKGGGVEDREKKIDQYIEMLKRMDPEKAAEYSREQIGEIIDTQYGRAGRISEALAGPEGGGAPRMLRRQGIVAEQPQQVSKAPAPGPMPESPPQESPEQAVAPPSPVLPNKPTGEPVAGGMGSSSKTSLSMSGGIGSLPNIQAPTIGDPTGRFGDPILNKYGLGNANAANASQAMEDTRQSTAAFMGRQGQQDINAELRQRLKDLDARYSDPNRQRSERIRSWMLGAGGAGSFASAMGGAGRSAEATRQRQYDAERQRIQDMIGFEGQASDQDFRIADRAQLSGDKAADRAAADARTAAQVAMTMDQAELNRNAKEAELKMRAYESEINKLKIESQERLRVAATNSTNTDRIQKLLTETRKTITETINKFIADDPMIQVLRQKAFSENATEADRAAFKRQEAALIAQAYQIMPFLLVEEERLAKQLKVPSLADAARDSVGGVKMSEDESSTVNQYLSM
jgi:hypothetical protein